MDKEQLQAKISALENRLEELEIEIDQVETKLDKLYSLLNSDIDLDSIGGQIILGEETDE